MDKRTKKAFLSSAVAVVLSVAITVSSMTACALVSEAILTVGEALLNTIANPPSYDEAFSNSYYETIHRNSVTGAVVGSVADATGLTSVSVGNYTFFNGKYALVYNDGAYNRRQVMVECSMYYRDNVPSNIDEITPYAHIEDSSGRDYLANNIYFDIWKDNGEHTRYRYWTSDTLNMSQMFDTTTWDGATGFLRNSGITIYRSNNSRYFDCSDGSAIGSAVDWTATNANIRLTYRDTNSIWVDHYGNAQPPSYAPTSQVWFYDDNGEYKGTYPLDEQICKGSVMLRSVSGSSGSTGAYGYIYTLGYFDTNSFQQNKIYAQNYGSPKSNTYIYNYDNSYQGGTVINNDNKDTIFDGTLTNIFNVDGTIALPVDLEASIKPRLDVALGDLNAKLTDFFTDMPDFGDLWTNRNTDNDYYQLDFPVPTPPTTGDINITVDITRPDIPFINTEPHVSFSYPTVTTTALPPSVLHAGGEIVSFGKDITDMVGTTNIIVVCGLIGVGVMLIFKDW